MLLSDMDEQKSSKTIDDLPSVASFMDTRLPYNMEYVVPMLLRIMVARGLISLNDARRIMKSGESYLH